MYLLICIFLGRKWEDSILNGMVASIPHILFALKFLCECSFGLLLLFPNILTLVHFQML
jgi:hypothetical protein